MLLPSRFSRHFLLKKNNRLKTNSQFSRVYKKGRSFVSDLFVLYVYKGNSDNKIIGFSVSKKVGKACIRNKIKRRAMEVIRLHINLINKKSYLVFVARKVVSESSYKDIEKSILKLLSKADLLEMN